MRQRTGDRSEFGWRELVVHVYVEKDMQLSELRRQDSYSYEIADLFLGGQSEQELHEKFRETMQLLDFQFSEVLPTNYS